jgi:Flp pilus assembly protein TadD, contains TPR repeats
MKSKVSRLKAFFTVLVLGTFLMQSFAVFSQDIVTSEDISGGSSVFVFRQSRKTTQTKVAFRSTVKRNTAAKTETRRKVQAQIVAYNKSKQQQRPKTKVDINKVDKNTVAAKTAAQKIKASEDLTGAADIFLERGETDLAIEYYQQAIALNPKNENAKIGLSEAYVARGNETAGRVRPTDTIGFFQKAIELNDKNAAAYAALAEIFDEQNQSDKALENYEKALALSPELTELYAPVGILYAQKGEIAKAEEYLEKASANGVKTAETEFFKGMVRYKQNRNEEALAAFTSAVKMDPNYAEAFYYQGETYDRLDREKEAIAAYKEAVRINPKYTEAWFDLGVAYYNRNRLEDAIAAYKEATRLKPDYGEAFLNLANVYRQLARYDEANAQYTIAEAFIKDNPDLYSEWGFCLGKVRKWNSAIQRLNQAVALNPDAVDYTNLGWAYYNAAQEDLRQKRQQDAEAKLAKGRDALQKATLLNPNLAAAFLNLGITQTDLGNYQAAVEALQQAVKLRKNWVSAINELGIAYRKLGDLDNAVKQFREATNIDKNFAVGFYNLGEAEYRRGNKKGAQQAHDRLKKLNPSLAKQLDVLISGAVYQGAVNELEKRIPKPKLPF